MYEEAKAQIDRVRKVDRELRAYCDREKADLKSM